jgi:hypothetical protein
MNRDTRRRTVNDERLKVWLMGLVIVFGLWVAAAILFSLASVG